MAVGGIRGNGRSRLIAALRLILPLSALGLLSMIFLLASPVDPTRAIETAEIDVAERARDPRLSAARFAGVTDDGAALRIEAGAARSDPGATLRFQVQELALWLDAAQGGQITARAAHGLIDRGAGSFAMTGDIALQATPGYQLTAARVIGQMDRTRIEATGPVAGQAPAGAITAGRLEISAIAGGAGGNRLVFDQGVRLIYQPDP